MTESDVLKRINNYLSLIRYENLAKEQLSRLQSLQNYYETLDKIPTKEKVLTAVISAEQLGSKLVLPLKVKGVFLTEGRHKKKYYTKEELKKAAANSLNQRIPLMLDHKNAEAGMIVGTVTKIWYDDSINGIRWSGNINDQTFALNVLDGTISQVSATIFSDAQYDETYGLIGTDLIFDELSLVRKPADNKTSIEVDN